MIILEGKTHQDPSIYIYLSFTFLSLWISIKWFTMEFFKNKIKELILISMSPFLAPLIDFIMDTNISESMIHAYNSFTQKLSMFGIEHQTNRPFMCSIILSAIMLTSTAIYLTISTLILIPFRLSTAIITMSSIKFASIMHSISPKRPIRPILILMGITGGTSPLWKYFA
jgi:3-hydroxymyristoyl/3-hydroxydecanoyl-(acyl carrier protein) dehydratase